MVGHSAAQMTTWISNLKTCQPKGSVSFVLLLCLCSGMLFYGEYRLTVLGLACAVPAALLVGLSTLFYGHDWYDGRYEDRCSPLFEAIMFYCWGLVMTGLCAVCKEKGFLAAVKDLDREQTVYLLVNMVSSAIALYMGRSVLIPVLCWDNRDAPWALL